MEINNLIFTVFFISLYAAILTAFIAGSAFIFFRRRRLKNEAQNQYNLTFMQIKVPQQNEIEIAEAEQMFAGFMGFKRSFFAALTKGQYSISFEIISKKEGIAFYVVAPDDLALHVEKQINAAYPTAEIDLIDPQEIWDRGSNTAIMELNLAGPEYFPIKTYTDNKTDTLNVITSAVSKLGPEDVVAIQYILRPAGNGWRKAGKVFVFHGAEPTSEAILK